MARDPRIGRFGLKGFNKPKRTPRHRTKLIRFGQQGVRTNQTPAQRRAFKARHAKNIARGKMSGAYWANRVKWSPSKTRRK